METRAITKNIRITPRKLRLVADRVREMSIDEALKYLPLIKKRASDIILKTLKSAISNAVNNVKLMEKNLLIKKIQVNGAPFLKRMRFGSRGRTKPYKKRASHLEIVLAEKIVKPEKVKAKEDKK